MDLESKEHEKTLVDFLSNTTLLTYVATGQKIGAKLVKLTPDLAQDLIDQRWWNEDCLDPVKTRKQMDRHWEWSPTFRDYRIGEDAGYVFGWALVTPDDEAQGAIIIKTNYNSYFEKSETGTEVPAVYIDRLATAPRNRAKVTKSGQGKYQGAGTILMNLSVAISYYMSGEGRVILTSLPNEETIEFYKRYGLEYTGVKYDEEKDKKFVDEDELTGDHLILMELRKEAATKILKKLRSR